MAPEGPHASPSVLARVSLDQSVASWTSRHEQDLAPDRWPYGLDKVNRYGCRLEMYEPSTAVPIRRVARKVRDHTGLQEWVEAAHRRLRRAPAPHDVLLCWDERTGIPEALLAGRAAPVVMGSSWLADPPSMPPRLERVAAQAVSRARFVFAQSTAQLPVLRDRFGLADDRLGFVPFGVDAGFFRCSEPEPTPDLVVSVGDDRHRDHEALIKAVALVQRNRPGARLELGTTLPVAVPPHLGTRIGERLGPRVRDLYARGSVVAIATVPNNHGSGMSVALEAMSSGRPVVAMRNGGVAEYVDDGVTGHLVDPDDIEGMATAVAGLLADPERAAAFGQAGRARVLERYTTDVQAAHLSELLRGIAASL